METGSSSPRRSSEGADVIRRAGAQDLPFLRDMLRHAYYARWGNEADVPLERYVAGWGRPGDTAVVAIDEFQPVGAAWYRTFPQDEPGYGFVDEETPELTIAVVPSRRGKGLGEEMLGELLDQARAEGYRRVSLSVEPDNPAIHLYEKHGFTKVGDRAGAWVMRAELY
jgi:ribosomal protein S18 acetylase RimI-like enzyme